MRANKIKVLNPSETPFNPAASLSKKRFCSEEKFLSRRDRRSPEYYSTDSHAHAINKYKYYCLMQKPFECFWVLLWHTDCWLNAAVISGDCAPDEDNAPNARPFSHLNKHFCTAPIAFHPMHCELLFHCEGKLLKYWQCVLTWWEKFINIYAGQSMRSCIYTMRILKKV